MPQVLVTKVRGNMKLLYDSTGKIYYSVYDRDWFSFIHHTIIPLSEFTIDEISEVNKKVCADLVWSNYKKDINGLGKYYIENKELYLRDNWEAYENIPDNEY
jgi:hypothetical protein